MDNKCGDSADEVIHPRVEETDPEPVITSGNPIDTVFDSLGFKSNKRLRVGTEQASTSNLSAEDELSTFLATIDVEKPAFTFFKEEAKSWPKLSKAAQILLCLLPSPANAERSFSKASFFTENREKNQTVAEKHPYSPNCELKR